MSSDFLAVLRCGGLNNGIEMNRSTSNVSLIHGVNNARGKITKCTHRADGKGNGQQQFVIGRQKEEVILLEWISHLCAYLQANISA